MATVRSAERRRRWSEEHKLRILEETTVPGVSAAEVARRYDLLPQQLYAWRRQFRQTRSLGALDCVGLESIAEVEAKAESERGRTSSGKIEIVLANGRSVRVSTEIKSDVLRRLIRTVEGA